MIGSLEMITSIWEDIGKLYCDADTQSEGDNTQATLEQSSSQAKPLAALGCTESFNRRFPSGTQGPLT